MGYWVPILCGLHQGELLFPYLYVIYVYNLINELRCSGYGVQIDSGLSVAYSMLMLLYFSHHHDDSVIANHMLTHGILKLTTQELTDQHFSPKLDITTLG